VRPDLLVAAALALAAPATAQTCTLQVDLAADPDGAGPPAWTWLRDQALGRLLGTGAGLGPRAALRLTWDEAGALRGERGATADDDGVYARFELRGGRTVLGRGSCSFDGAERWLFEPGAGAQPAPIGDLVARFGPEVRTGWLELDLAAAIGNLMPGVVPGDVHGELLTLGAEQCGTVAVLARSGSGAAVQIVGRSGGGLALPALLLTLAAPRSADPRPAAGAVERWLLLAATARAAEQEEAARQLGRFDDPRAVRALERLLFADGRIRLVAMHGLGRLRARGSISAILAAVDEEVPGSAEVAARVVGAMAPDGVRRAWAGAGAADLAAPAAPGGSGGGARAAPPDAAVPPTGDRRWLPALLGGLAGGAAIALVLARRR
jgi:hypothetical protein